VAKIAYITRRFTADSREVITKAEAICEQYAAEGYDLTLRQLFYQFVARGWLPNTDASYDRLGSIINGARLAGLIDWDHLTDRTRNLASLPTWADPASIIETAARQYREDKWAAQPEYVEVWVEKEALAGVVARPAERWQVPYFSCRGYVSQSEMHAAAQRIRHIEVHRGAKVTIVHLGDHDPSGLDMTRDIRDRLEMFGCRASVNRIALNMDQVERYQPPPNPAKLTDSRAADYIELYGPESWELDALDPATLDGLIDAEIQAHLDPEQWAADLAEEEEHQQGLVGVAARWDAVQVWLEGEDAG